MNGIIAIVGGLVGAATCLIPLVNGDDSYTDNEVILNAVGYTLSAGLVLLSYSLTKNRYWYITLPISVLLMLYGFCYLYDHYLDSLNKFNTTHFAITILFATLSTLIICVYYKLQQRQR